MNENSNNDSSNSTNATEPYPSLPEELYPTLTVIYLCIFVIGIIGNSLVILVIIKDKKMRSVANFFLISLSAADLMIILFCLPVAVYELYNSHDWIFGVALCKLTPYLQYLSVNASMLTMLAISIERLLVICLPLKAKSYCTKRRTLVTIICIWVLCAVTSFPAFLFTTIMQGVDESMGINITMCITQTTGHEWYLLCQGVLFYILPGLLLLVIYAVITKSLRSASIEHSLQVNNSMSRKFTRKRESRQQIILMLGVVVIAYFICLLPFNVIVLLAILSPQTLHYMDPNEYTILLSATRVLFFINSCINPILYNAISQKFRAAFLRFFRFRHKMDGKSFDNSDYRQLTGSVRFASSSRKSVVSEMSIDDRSYCTLLKNGDCNNKRASVDKFREQLL